MKRKLILILSVLMIMASLSANIFAQTPSYFSINASDRNNYTTRINGVTIPLDEYPVGSYFNRVYEGASQCFGFSKYVLDQLFDVHEEVDLYLSIQNATDAKEFIAQLWPGTLVRTQNSEGGKHAFIYLGTDSTGVIVYHANWADIPSQENIVRISHFTWNEFKKAFVEILFIDAPHYVETWESISSKLHEGYCRGCGEYHTGRHMAEVAGMGTCMACGYYGNMDGIQNIGVNEKY